MTKEALGTHSNVDPSQVHADLQVLDGFLRAFPSLEPDTQAQVLSDIDEWSDGPDFQGNHLLRLGVKGAILGVQPDAEAVETFYTDALKPLLTDETGESREAIKMLDGVISYHTDMLKLGNGNSESHLQALSGPGIMETWMRRVDWVKGLDSSHKKQVLCMLRGFAVGVALPEYRYKRMSDLELEIAR